MQFLLSLNPKNLILLKVLTHDGPSKCSTYKAYDEITTYRYVHNHDGLINMFREHGYNLKEVQQDGMSHFLLMGI
jgi:hypothetical protein